ncbi:MAG: arylsulfatase A-like enzyme [Halieaceae bacterium]
MKESVLARILFPLALLFVGSVTQAATRPNVLIIIADDMGYTDLGSFGGEIATPNLDKLAMQGVRFSHFHVMPACSPTRAALYTGVDPHLAGVGNMYEELSPNQKGQPGYEGHLNESVVTVATLLGDSGYRTYLSGKWHLASETGHGPGSQGFQHSFALSSGGASHFADMLPAYDPDPNGKALYTEDDKPLGSLPEEFQYSSQFYVDRLLGYLREESVDPFFAVLSFTAPHWPLQAPADSIARYRGKYDEGYDVLYAQRRARVAELGLIPLAEDPPRPPKAVPWSGLDEKEKKVQSRYMEVYAAMIDEMDAHTGRLIDFLDESGELDNTLIIFLSDNGPEGHDLDETWSPVHYPQIRKVIDERHDFSFDNIGHALSYAFTGAGWARASSAGLRMYKAFPSEGGTRVTAFARLPGTIKPASILGSSLSVKDIAPTILEITGVEHPGVEYQGRKIHPMQGVSVLPQLIDPSAEVASRVVGTELFGKYSLRKGDWKLLVMAPPYASGEMELYRVGVDPGETVNLASAEPERFAQMKELWQQYAADNGVILPDWVSGY